MSPNKGARRILEPSHSEDVQLLNALGRPHKVRCDGTSWLLTQALRLTYANGIGYCYLVFCKVINKQGAQGYVFFSAGTCSDALKLIAENKLFGTVDGQIVRTGKCGSMSPSLGIG